MSRSRNPPPKGQGAARAKQVTSLNERSLTDVFCNKMHGSTTFIFFTSVSGYIPCRWGCSSTWTRMTALMMGGTMPSWRQNFYSWWVEVPDPKNRKVKAKVRSLFIYYNNRTISIEIKAMLFNHVIWVCLVGAGRKTRQFPLCYAYKALTKCNFCSHFCSASLWL